MRLLTTSRSRRVLPVILMLLVACRSEPPPPPPIPTPVPRTPVPLSPRAITAENAEQVQLLGCPESVGWVYAFSPDGGLLADSCGSDLCLHDAHTLALAQHLERDPADDGDPGDPIYSVAFSPDGTLVAAGTSSGMVWLWRVSDGAVERVLDAGRHRLLALAFSADGTTLVASDLTPEVFVWRVAGGELLRSFKGVVPRNYRPQQPIAVALSPDGALLALKERGEVRLWRTDDGSLLRVLNVPGPDTGDVAFSSDGRLLAAGSLREIGLWELQGMTLSPMRSIDWAGGSSPLSLSPDGSLLATGSASRTLLIRRVEDGTTLLSLDLKEPKGMSRLLFSPDGSLLASSGRGVPTCLWGLAP